MTLRPFAAAAGLVVNAPVKATCHAVRAWSTVLFVPLADGLRVSTRFGTTFLPPEQVAVVTFTEGCWPPTVTAFVAVAIAAIAYVWFALKVRGKMQMKVSPLCPLAASVL